jgi:hypothetical protein
MPKYLCVGAFWLEADDATAAADAFEAGVRTIPAKAKGAVTVYDVAQTEQDGFLLSMEQFDLAEAVVPPESKGKDAS